MQFLLTFPDDITEAEAEQLIRDAFGEFHQRRSPAAFYVHERYDKALATPAKVAQVHQRNGWARDVKYEKYVPPITPHPVLCTNLALTNTIEEDPDVNSLEEVG